MKIMFFGITKELAGSASLDVTERFETVGALRGWLSLQYPAMLQLRKVMIAVNKAYAGDEQLLAENDEVAIIPPLSGGKSLRMQQDKSQIDYHGQPQWQYLYNLLKGFVPEVWLSAREGQEFPGCEHIIRDSVEGAGPSAGLLSAHAHDPAASWLVLACDLPLISEQSISMLLEKRQPQQAATSFISPYNEQPEPLIAIWEPAGLKQLAADFRAGKTCPRKTLASMEVMLLENPYRREQYNANTPEEMENAREKLK